MVSKYTSKIVKKGSKIVCLDKLSRQNERKRGQKSRLDKLSKRRGGGSVNEMKTEMLRVRMTPEDKQALYMQARRNHKTMSEYIRTVAKRPPDVTRDEFDASITRMIYEINKIGVNINQIAKKYNEHKFVKPSEDLLEKLDEVSEMIKSMILVLCKSQFEE